MNQKFLITNLHDYINKHQILNEASFHSFDNDDILTDKYVQSYLNQGYGYMLLQSYMYENDLENEDEYDVLDSPEYFSYIKNDLEEHLEIAKENLYYIIDYDTNKITIYRAITVDDNWLHHLKTQGKRLGIYWSWSEDGAETHWGDYSKKNEAIIVAEIDEKYVDWKTTLEMNMNPSLSDEKEIRLFKNTPLKIKSISINGKDIDLSLIGNKIFYS